MGRVIERTFAVIKRNLVSFLIVALMIMVPVVAIDLYNGTPSYFGAKSFLLGALAALIQVACTYLLQASLVQSTITDLNGERSDLGRALSAGFGLVVPVTVIAILSILGMVLATLLLVVPGIMLAVAWSVAVPVKVVERTGIKESLARSWDLTRGYRWKIFGLILFYFIASIIFGFLATLITGASLAGAGTALHNTPYIVVQWLLTVILTIFTAVGVTVIYYELRTVKEGMASQELAAAFD
jgi:hypothetical protein